MHVKFISLLGILEERKNELRELYSKYIGDGIFELRCKVGTDISRCMYLFYHEHRIILLNRFIKKAQK